jgi:hypothetical protein
MHAVPYKPNLGSARILSLFNLKFSKKVAAVGLSVSGYADLLKPTYVAARPQPTRLFVRPLFSPLLQEAWGEDRTAMKLRTSNATADQNRRNSFLINSSRLLYSRRQLGGPRAFRLLSDLRLARRSAGPRGGR